MSSLARTVLSVLSLPHREDRKPLTIKEQLDGGSAAQRANTHSKVAHTNNPNILEAEAGRLVL